MNPFFLSSLLCTEPCQRAELPMLLLTPLCCCSVPESLLGEDLQVKYFAGISNVCAAALGREDPPSLCKTAIVAQFMKGFLCFIAITWCKNHQSFQIPLVPRGMSSSLCRVGKNFLQAELRMPNISTARSEDKVSFSRAPYLPRPHQMQLLSHCTQPVRG